MSDGSSMKVGDKAMLDLGKDFLSYSKEARSFDKKVVVLRERVSDVGWYFEGFSRWIKDECFKSLDIYGKSLKPGDKAILDLGKDVRQFHCLAREWNGKVVTIHREVPNGWLIEEASMWFAYERFCPLTVDAEKSDQCCNVPCIKENFANFKKFFVCTNCGKEV